jgi:hypothetical protein
LHVCGLYSSNESTDIHPRWANEELTIGDEVIVKIVDADTADEPAEKKVNTSESIEQEQRKYYLAMKKKFEPEPPRAATEQARASRKRTRMRNTSRKKGR